MQAACLRGHQAPPVLPPRASPLTRGARRVWRAPLSRSSPGRGADGQPERLKSTKGALAVPPEPPPSVPLSAPVAPQRCQQLRGSLSQHSSSGTSSAMPAVPMEAPGPVPVPWPAEPHPPQHTQPCTKPYLRPCSSHSPTPAETRQVQPRAASPAQSCSLSQALPNALPHPGSLHRGGSESSPPPEKGRRAKAAVGCTWSHSSALQEGIGHKQDSKHAPLSAPFPAGDTQLLTSSSRS